MHPATLRTAIAAACLPALLTAAQLEIPAWSFDRGNVRTFTEQWADAAPMVAFGGDSPVRVEYEIPVPADGRYRLQVLYAAGTPRPVDLSVDGKPAGKACREVTGGWLTSQAKWDDCGEFDWRAGTRVLRFERPEAFPHLVALRLDSPALPQGYRPRRPHARTAASAGLAPEPDADPAARIGSLRLAIDDLGRTYGGRYPQAAAFLARLAEIEARHRQGAAVGTELDALQQAALTAHPLLDRERLLVLRRCFPEPAEARRAMGDALGVGSLNAHTSETVARQNRWRDQFVMLAPGGARQVFAPPAGETLLDPVLSFDARRLLFAMQGRREQNWRLWETGLDGSGLRQISPDDGTDVGHFDPCYLPDGKIIFASTAVYQGLPCQFGNRDMVCLYRLDPASGEVRQLTFEQDSDWCPTVLDDGRVLYLRWEYTDQSHSNSRILFQMNPDGTGQREFRGSGSWFPGSFFYAKPLPGQSTRVIGVAGGHHGTPRSGRLLILDPSQGRRDDEGIVQEIPYRGRKVEPVVRDRLVDGVWPQFLMPHPLDSNHFLVAAKLNPRALWGIYLVDTFDNVTLVHEEEGAALLWPMIARPVKPPHLIPDRVDPARDTATVMIGDIHRGPGLQGVPRGTVRKLRVIEYSFSKRGFGGLYGTLGSDGPWDVKRILGTVPVEADGSAHFTIPANTPLSLQPLDEKGQALQLMRSWFVGMPGEAVSCTGCHEPQDEATPPLVPSLAMRGGPAAIEPWHGPARGFSFEREVQPVLDRHCVSCHDGDKAAPSLVGGRPLTDWSSQMAGQWQGGGKFTHAYFELQRFVRRPGIEGDRRMFTPLEYHFSTTELGQMLEHGHQGTRLDPESRERLAAWADLNAPFFGRWSEIPQFQPGTAGGKRLAAVNGRADELRRRYVPAGPHPDHEAAPPPADYDRTPVAPLPPAPAQAAPPAPEGWPFDAATALAMQQAGAPGGKTARTLDLGDGVTLDLVRVPGGRLRTGGSEGQPGTASAVRELAPFWIARTETTNRQLRAFRPEHDSRTEDRIGYQFGALGYDVNQPEQPAVRVAWHEALDFCRWLAARSGLAIALPDETQWEWACRAGTATPFWFGDAGADWSSCANLGDQRLAEFAADTSLDHYTAARPMNNPSRYDAWIPRDDRFNDRGFVSMPVASYRPNPWGLHDMHGNVWEWTGPARATGTGTADKDPAANSGLCIARGGSWYDRPQRATSSFRLAYPPWQRVFNVGFRIVCPDPGEPATARNR